MSSRLQIWLGMIFVAAGMVFLLTQLIPIATDSRDGSAVLQVQASNAGMQLDEADGGVYVYQLDSPGQLVAEGRITQPLAVPAGRYDVRVRFSGSRDQQTQWLRALELSAGERVTRSVEFAAGELRIESSIGSADYEAGEVVAYVFRPGEHEEIVTSLGPEEPIVLGAGEYDLRVVWSVNAQEKDVRWFYRVQVKTGLQTRLEVLFNRGVLSVAAQNGGLPMPLGTVALTIYQAGDSQRRILDTGMAGVPMGLAIGSYDVKATFIGSSDKPNRWLRNIEISNGRQLEEVVEFSSGKLSVNAQLRGGPELPPYDVYVYIYRAGEHQEALAYIPSGDVAILEKGQYDVRVHFYRSSDRPDIWLRNLAVDSGVTNTQNVSFPSGRLLLRAYDEAGTELIGDTVFVYVYSRSERTHHIAVVKSGEYVTLTEGTYDLRAVDTRGGSETIWLSDIRLQAGSIHEETVKF